MPVSEWVTSAGAQGKPMNLTSHVTRGSADSGLKTHERQIAVDGEISFVASARNYAEIVAGVVETH